MDKFTREIKPYHRHFELNENPLSHFLYSGLVLGHLFHFNLFDVILISFVDMDWFFSGLIFNILLNKFRILKFLRSINGTNSI